VGVTGGSSHRFRDRADAGAALAEQVAARLLAPDAPAADRGAVGSDVVVLALPRGGVPVAFPVAERLGAELDVLVVRKLGVPGQPELAMGAVGPGGVLVVDDALARQLRVTTAALEQVVVRERAELARREAAFRAGRPPLNVTGRTVVLVDDGIATGATARAAVQAARALGPARVVVAAPTAAGAAVALLRAEADDVVVVDQPEPYLSVGWWYERFTQTTDDEVRELLARAARA
jgi:putative phosphoribosyl transferase